MASRLFFMFVLVGVLIGMAYAQPAKVWIVQSEAGGVYAETVAALRQELNGLTVKDGLAATVLDGRETPPALIVTVGTFAFEGTLRWLRQQPPPWTRVPVLASLLPRSAYWTHAAPSEGRHLSAVLLDQPWARQFALLRRALPDRQRVGVLPGPETRPLLPLLEAEARAHGLRLIVGPPIDVSEQIYPSLRDVLLEADVLLAIPDALVFNPNTLRNILLTSYRARVPLVAFSAAYVKAGALFAVHSTPAQIARQTAQVARGVLAGKPLPPPQSPKEFVITVNPRVAASLGILLDDIERLAEERRAFERP